MSCQRPTCMACRRAGAVPVVPLGCLPSVPEQCGMSWELCGCGMQCVGGGRHSSWCVVGGLCVLGRRCWGSSMVCDPGGACCWCMLCWLCLVSLSGFGCALCMPPTRSGTARARLPRTWPAHPGTHHHSVAHRPHGLSSTPTDLLGCGCDAGDPWPGRAARVMRVCLGFRASAGALTGQQSVSTLEQQQVTPPGAAARSS